MCSGRYMYNERSHVWRKRHWVYFNCLKPWYVRKYDGLILHAHPLWLLHTNHPTLALMDWASSNRTVYFHRSLRVPHYDYKSIYLSSEFGIPNHVSRRERDICKYLQQAINRKIQDNIIHMNSGMFWTRKCPLLIAHF